MHGIYASHFVNLTFRVNSSGIYVGRKPCRGPACLDVDYLRVSCIDDLCLCLDDFPSMGMGYLFHSKNPEWKNRLNI